MMNYFSTRRSYIKLQINSQSWIIDRISVKPWTIRIIVRILKMLSFLGIVYKIGFPIRFS